MVRRDHRGILIAYICAYLGTPMISISSCIFVWNVEVIEARSKREQKLEGLCESAVRELQVEVRGILVWIQILTMHWCVEAVNKSKDQKESLRYLFAGCSPSQRSSNEFKLVTRDFEIAVTSSCVNGAYLRDLLSAATANSGITAEKWVQRSVLMCYAECAAEIIEDGL